MPCFSRWLSRIRLDLGGDRQEHFHFFNSFFYKKYIDSKEPGGRHLNVKKWTKSVDIFNGERAHYAGPNICAKLPNPIRLDEH